MPKSYSRIPFHFPRLRPSLPVRSPAHSLTPLLITTNVNRYRVVLFCSYGSPSSHPVCHDIGTPLSLHHAARISLMPREGSEGWIGMLLTRSKFDEVVSQFKYPLNLHPDLLDIILGWPVGHVGAVVEMLHIISSEASCFCLITLFLRSQRKHFLTLPSIPRVFSSS